MATLAVSSSSSGHAADSAIRGGLAPPATKRVKLRKASSLASSSHLSFGQKKTIDALRREYEQAAADAASATKQRLSRFEAEVYHAFTFCIPQS